MDEMDRPAQPVDDTFPSTNWMDTYAIRDFYSSSAGPPVSVGRHDARVMSSNKLF